MKKSISFFLTFSFFLFFLSSQISYAKKQTTEERYAEAISILFQTHDKSETGESQRFFIDPTQAKADTQKALQILERIVEEGENPPGIYAVMGAAYFKLRDADSALKYYKLSIEKEPQNGTAYPMLLFLLREQKDFDGAFELIEVYRNYFPKKVGWYYFYRGSTYHQMRQHEKVIDEMNLLLNEVPEFPQAHLLLGASYLALGNKTEAEKNFSILLDKNPDFIEQVNFLRTEIIPEREEV